MARHRTKGANLPVPQDDSEARNAIRSIGDLQRIVERMKADLDDQVAALKEDYANRAGPVNGQIEEKIEGLRLYCEAHRDRLTGGGKVKYHDFTTGKINWRHRPARVRITGMETVIEALKAARLTRFLREKPEVNKEAMLASEEDRLAASAIKGVSIGSDGEDFIVEPYETDLEQAS